MTKWQLLTKGDEIRIVAPSQGIVASRKAGYDRATKRLESLGYKVTFGKYLTEKLHLNTAHAKHRAEDLTEAYKDNKVRAILALNGGWSANEILPLLDWDVISKNPKPLVGYSDITILHNAIYAKTGAIGLLGPNLGTLGNTIEWNYTADSLNAALTDSSPQTLLRSKKWGSWKGKSHINKPWQVISEGKAKGALIGGNIGTFYLLQGTEYMPRFDRPFILAVEDDEEAGKYTTREFSRRLESLLQQPGSRNNLRGMLIGRFQPGSKIKMPELKSVIESKNLGDIPVLAGLDFGHTLPIATLPIGGIATIDTSKLSVILETK